MKNDTVLILLERTFPTIEYDVVAASENRAVGKPIGEAESHRMVLPTVTLWNGLEVLATLAMASALIAALAFCLATFVGV
jgi:hypothetical protein